MACSTASTAPGPAWSSSSSGPARVTAAQRHRRVHVGGAWRSRPAPSGRRRPGAGTAACRPGSRAGPARARPHSPSRPASAAAAAAAAGLVSRVGTSSASRRRDGARQVQADGVGGRPAARAAASTGRPGAAAMRTRSLGSAGSVVTVMPGAAAARSRARPRRSAPGPISVMVAGGQAAPLRDVVVAIGGCRRRAVGVVVQAAAALAAGPARGDEAAQQRRGHVARSRRTRRAAPP